jgi:hypothetical protein
MTRWPVNYFRFYWSVSVGRFVGWINCCRSSPPQSVVVSGSVGTHDHIFFFSKNFTCFEMGPPVLRRKEKSDIGHSPSTRWGDSTAHARTCTYSFSLSTLISISVGLNPRSNLMDTLHNGVWSYSCVEPSFLRLSYLFWLQEHGKHCKEAISEHVIYFEKLLFYFGSLKTVRTDK